MTRLLVTDPGVAARTAKNENATPGLPNQARKDSKGRAPMVATNTRNRELAVSRRRTVCALTEACSAAQVWTNFVRQEAADRLGSDESARLLDDPAVWEAVVAAAQVRDALALFEAAASRINDMRADAAGTESRQGVAA